MKIIALQLLCAIASAHGAFSLPQPDTPPGVTIRNVKLETFTNVSSVGSIAGAPDSNPNHLPLPVDGSLVKVERTELHVYSMDVNNNGPKAIRALVWDVIFA